MFDPHCWGKESYYDELARVQKEEMDKREKERKDKTKVSDCYPFPIFINAFIIFVILPHFPLSKFVLYKWTSYSWL